jgi:hypothetical protein
MIGFVIIWPGNGDLGRGSIGCGLTPGIMHQAADMTEDEDGKAMAIK